MRAGALNRRIQIQQQDSGQDDAGQPVDTWTDVANCWAAINAATGKEVYASAGYTSQLSHVITMRLPAVTVRSKMRVLYDGRAWLIQAVMNPDEGARELKLLCLELNEGT